MKWIQGGKKRWILLIDRACAGIIITKFTFLVKCWKFAVFLNRRKKKHWRIQLCCLKIFIHREYVGRPAWISGVLVIQSAVSGHHWFGSFTYLIVACMWTGPHYSCPHLWCSRYLPWTWRGCLYVDVLLPGTDRRYWYAILAVQLPRELRICALGGRDCQQQSVFTEQLRGACVSVGTATSIVTDRKFPVFKKFRSPWRVYFLKFWFHISFKSIIRPVEGLYLNLRHLIQFAYHLNPLNPELNPICYLLALLGAQHFLHVSRIRVKLLTFRLLMSHIYIYIYIYIWSTHSWCF